MYEPTSYRYPFAPTPKGFGQVASCPSMAQLTGSVDCTDPCQVNSAPCTAAIDTMQVGNSCFNTSTGLQMPCPVAGSTQSVPPGSSGPFGTLSAGVTNLNWGLLAAVAGGLFLLAAMSGK